MTQTTNMLFTYSYTSPESWNPYDGAYITLTDLNNNSTIAGMQYPGDGGPYDDAGGSAIVTLNPGVDYELAADSWSDWSAPPNASYDFSLLATDAPEPPSWALMLGGLAVLGLLHIRLSDILSRPLSLASYVSGVRKNVVKFDLEPEGNQSEGF